MTDCGKGRVSEALQGRVTITDGALAFWIRIRMDSNAVMQSICNLIRINAIRIWKYLYSYSNISLNYSYPMLVFTNTGFTIFDGSNQ